MTDTARESRTCAKCGANDTHSHHIQYVAFNHPITGDPVDMSITKHVQCCADDGCPICQTDVEHADDATIGDGFTDHMANKSDEHLAALFDRHGIASPGHEATSEGETI